MPRRRLQSSDTITPQHIMMSAIMRFFRMTFRSARCHSNPVDLDQATPNRALCVVATSG